jgi:adenylate kinase
MLGAPGTGKGTVANILSKKLEIPQVSTGDIFRKNIKEKTEVGEIANKYISEGKLVPDDITIEIVKNRLQEDDVKNGIILDGFPRTVFQAEELEKILEKENKKVDMVINLTTPEEEIIERVVNRRICANQECRAVYNITLNPPKVEGICDKCGSKLIKREDDNPETTKKRIQTYLNLTAPLIEYYTNKGNLCTELVSKETKLGAEVAEEIVERIKGE